MRTLLLALTCVASVAAGAALAHLPAAGALSAALGLLVGLTALAGLLGLSPAYGVLDEAPPRPRDRHLFLALIALVSAAGLLRGLSVPPSPTAAPELRAAQRGVPAQLREFTVLGASEPGPRCQFTVRDSGATWLTSAPVRLSAPASVCPRWAGQAIALDARDLSPSGLDLLTRGAGGDLDLGPTARVWRRPPSPDAWRRVVPVRYWRAVALERQLAWEQTRGDDPGSFAVAVALGLRAALTPGRRESLRRAGLGHLIAVSGLHVTLAALWLQLALRRIGGLSRASPRATLALAWLPLLAYVGLTGAPPSAVRAAAMLLALDLGTARGRPCHGPTLLAAIAAAMLLVRPAWIFDPGFQLSLAAMAAIVTAPRSDSFLELLALSWRISWATAPISVLHFGSAPMHGLVANTLALPAFALLMPLALFGALALPVLGPGALEPARVFAAPLLEWAELLAAAPSLGPLSLAALAALALLLHGLRRRFGPARARARTWARTRARARVGPRADPPLWLPPRLPCVLAVCVGLASLAPPRPARPDPSQTGQTGETGETGETGNAAAFDWVAVGSVSSRSVLVADPHAPGSACLYRPTLSSRAWLALFEEHGVTRLGHLSARLPPEQPPSDEAPLDPRGLDPRGLDPRGLDLRLRLEASGLPVERSPQDGLDRCTPPPRAEVRAALRECRWRRGGRGRAWVYAQGDRRRCRVEGRWVELLSSQR